MPLKKIYWRTNIWLSGGRQFKKNLDLINIYFPSYLKWKRNRLDSFWWMRAPCLVKTRLHWYYSLFSHENSSSWLWILSLVQLSCWSSSALNILREVMEVLLFFFLRCVQLFLFRCITDELCLCIRLPRTRSWMLKSRIIPDAERGVARWYVRIVGNISRCT